MPGLGRRTAVAALVAGLGLAAWTGLRRDGPVEPARAAPVAIANRDPDALPVGLWFASDMPTAHRRLLAEDMAWLAGLRRLKDSETWAPALGLPEAATGADALAFILSRIRVLQGFGRCALGNSVIVSNLNADHPASLYKAYQACAPYDHPDVSDTLGMSVDMKGGADWSRGEVDAVVSENHVVVLRGRREPGIVSINLDLLNRKGAILGRVARLGTLLHEAMHIGQGGKSHSDCGSLARILPRTGATNLFMATTSRLDLSPDTACDATSSGPYPIEGAFALSLLGAMEATNPADILKVADFSADRSYRTSLKVPGGRLSPEATRWILPLDKDRQVAVVPPRIWFVARRIDLQARLRDPKCTGKCRLGLEHVDKALAVLDELDAAGRMPPGWARPERAPKATGLDPDGAARWARAAVASADRGHNPAVTFAVPCAQLSRGCEVH